MLFVKTIVCGVAISFVEITLILQPTRSDVTIGLVHAHGNRLLVSRISILVLAIKM